jgi:hypothetical protein
MMGVFKHFVIYTHLSSSWFFFLHCSFAFKVEKGHVGYVELLLAHPSLLLKLLKMEKK